MRSVSREGDSIMKLVTLAVLLLGLASLMGCSSDSDTLKKAQAETDAAKTELAKVKAELDQLKAQLAAQDAKNKSAAAAEEAVRKAASDFYLDLSQGRLRSVYDSMSAAYKSRNECKAFDEFVEKHPGLKGVHRDDGFGRYAAPLKIRKLAKDNVFECDCQTSYIGGYINITLRLVHEDGAWKVDDFVDIKDTPG